MMESSIPIAASASVCHPCLSIYPGLTTGRYNAPSTIFKECSWRTWVECRRFWWPTPFCFGSSGEQSWCFKPTRMQTKCHELPWYYEFTMEADHIAIGNQALQSLQNRARIRAELSYPRITAAFWKRDLLLFPCLAAELCMVVHRRLVAS